MTPWKTAAAVGVASLIALCGAAAQAEPVAGDKPSQSPAKPEGATSRQAQKDDVKAFKFRRTIEENEVKEIKPVEVGQRAPDVIFRNSVDEQVSLTGLLAESATVLVFFRGAWCPYCITHLKELGEVEPQLKALGYQIVAVSPDAPYKLDRTAEKNEVGYPLLSDANLSAAKAFGIAFALDSETVESYKGYGIDLEKTSGGANTRNELPHPAVYLIDKEGVVQFAYWEPDYTVRLSGAKLLAAAEGHAEKGTRTVTRKDIESGTEKPIARPRRPNTGK